MSTVQELRERAAAIKKKIAEKKASLDLSQLRAARKRLKRVQRRARSIVAKAEKAAAKAQKKVKKAEG